MPEDQTPILSFHQGHYSEVINNGIDQTLFTGSGQFHGLSIENAKQILTSKDPEIKNTIPTLIHGIFQESNRREGNITSTQATINRLRENPKNWPEEQVNTKLAEKQIVEATAIEEAKEFANGINAISAELSTFEANANDQSKIEAINKFKSIYFSDRPRS